MSRSRMKSLFKFGRTKSTTDLAEWSKNDEKLLKAVEGGDVKKVTSILARKTIVPTKLGPRGYSIFHTACTIGNEQIVEVLMKHVDDVNDLTLQGNTPLQLAASKGHTGVVSRLIQAGADVDMKDHESKVALHHACAALHLECVQVLLAHSANPKVRDESGKTPLIYAAHRGDVAICKWLVDKGADVNAQDVCHMTPLMAAAREGRREVCDFLLRKGADPSHTDKEGHNALQYAVPGGHHKLLKEVFDNAPTRASWDIDSKQPDSTRTSEGTPSSLTLAALADQVDTVSAFKESPVLEHHPRLVKSQSADISASDSQAVSLVEPSKPQEKLEPDRDSTEGDAAAAVAVAAATRPVEETKPKVQPLPSHMEVSRQKSEKAYRELEEEHEQLNEDYHKLSIDNLKLRDQVQSLQGKLAAKSHQTKPEIPAELENELQTLKKRLEEELERTRDLEAQLEARSRPVSRADVHLERKSADSPAPSPELATSDNWGDSDEDFDQASPKKHKGKLSMDDKQMIALLRSQILTLRQENDHLKEKLQSLPNGLREPSPYLFPSPAKSTPCESADASTDAASPDLDSLREKVATLEREKSHLLEQLSNAQVSDSASSLQLNGSVQHEELVRQNMVLQEEVERLRTELASQTEGDITLTTNATPALTPPPRKTRQARTEGVVNGDDHSEESTEDRSEEMERKTAVPEGEAGTDAALQEENQRLTEVVAVLQTELDKLRKTFNAILKAGDDLQADYDQLQLQKEQLLHEKEDLMKENEFLLTDGNSLHDDLKKLVHELEKMQEKCDKATKEKEDLARTMEAVSLTGKVGETVKILEERDKLTAQNEELKKMTEKLQHDHEILLEEVESLQEQTSGLTQERDQLAVDLEEAEGILEQHEALQQDYTTLEADYTALLSQRDSLEQELLEAQSAAPAHVKIERTSSASGQDWMAVEAEREAWTGEKEQLELTIGEQSAANALLEEEMAKVRSEVDTLRGALDNALSGMSTLKQTLATMATQMSSSKDDRKALVEQLEEALLELARVKALTSDLASAPSTNEVSGRTTPLVHQVHSLEIQVSNLQMQLAEMDGQHKEVIAAYRAHLISAVQGHMDDEVRQALHHIIDLRSMEQFC